MASPARAAAPPEDAPGLDEEDEPEDDLDEEPGVPVAMADAPGDASGSRARRLGPAVGVVHTLTPVAFPAAHIPCMS